jgi:hypothetical protein
VWQLLFIVSAPLHETSVIQDRACEALLQVFLAPVANGFSFLGGFARDDLLDTKCLPETNPASDP